MVFQFEFLGVEVITNLYLLEPIIVNANRSGPEALIHPVRMTFRKDILIGELDSVYQLLVAPKGLVNPIHKAPLSTQTPGDKQGQGHNENQI